MDRGSQQQQTVTPRAFCTVRAWCELSGMRRTGTFAAIARGDIPAIKLGRSTLIEVAGGLAWMRSLPPAGPAPRRA